VPGPSARHEAHGGTSRRARRALSARPPSGRASPLPS
jgi:hypothetical protein